MFSVSCSHRSLMRSANAARGHEPNPSCPCPAGGSSSRFALLRQTTKETAAKQTAAVAMSTSNRRSTSGSYNNTITNKQTRPHSLPRPPKERPITPVQISSRATSEENNHESSTRGETINDRLILVSLCVT